MDIKICFNSIVSHHLASPLDYKEIQPVHPKGDQSWVFIGRTDAEAETPILLPHEKSWLIGKDPDAGRDWGQEEKGTTEDEMAGWHHWLDAHEFGWTPGVGDGQGGLACCDSCGRKELDTTERLTWTELIPSSGLRAYWEISCFVFFPQIKYWMSLLILALAQLTSTLCLRWRHDFVTLWKIKCLSLFSARLKKHFNIVDVNITLFL